MPILPRAESQRGVTLFELLIVLAVLSLATGTVGLALRASGPSFAVRAAAERLEGDLRRASAAARGGNDTVEVLVTKRGYVSQAIGLNATFGRGVELMQEAGPSVTFYPDGHAEPAVLVLTRGDAERVVTVQAYTGRVYGQ